MRAPSLTAILLLGKPITLPAGQVTFHSADHVRQWEVTPGQRRNAMRNNRNRQDNIESVFKAISAGRDTIHAIVDHTELSESTVKKALNDLEDLSRIVRDSAQLKHRFRLPEQPS